MFRNPLYRGDDDGRRHGYATPSPNCKDQQSEGIKTILELRTYKTYLKRRLKEIRKSNKSFELHEQVEDIDFYLEVMNDSTSDSIHGVDGLRSFVSKIQEMQRKNPLSEPGDSGDDISATEGSVGDDNKKPEMSEFWNDDNDYVEVVKLRNRGKSYHDWRIGEILRRADEEDDKLPEWWDHSNTKETEIRSNIMPEQQQVRQPPPYYDELAFLRDYQPKPDPIWLAGLETHFERRQKAPSMENPSSTPQAGPIPPHRFHHQFNHGPPNPNPYVPLSPHQSETSHWFFGQQTSCESQQQHQENNRNDLSQRTARGVSPRGRRRRRPNLNKEERLPKTVKRVSFAESVKTKPKSILKKTYIRKNTSPPPKKVSLSLREKLGEDCNDVFKLGGKRGEPVKVSDQESEESKDAPESPPPTPINKAKNNKVNKAKVNSNKAKKSTGKRKVNPPAKQYSLRKRAAPLMISSESESENGHNEEEMQTPCLKVQLPNTVSQNAATKSTANIQDEKQIDNKKTDSVKQVVEELRREDMQNMNKKKKLHLAEEIDPMELSKRTFLARTNKNGGQIIGKDCILVNTNLGKINLGMDDKSGFAGMKTEIKQDLEDMAQDEENGDLQNDPYFVNPLCMVEVKMDCTDDFQQDNEMSNGDVKTEITVN